MRTELIGGSLIAGAFLAWGSATILPHNGWIQDGVVPIALRVLAIASFLSGVVYFIRKDVDSR